MRRPPLIINEIPVFHLDKKIIDSLQIIDSSFLLQLQKLNSSRRSSLSSDTNDEFAPFGTWRYIWGSKATPNAENDDGLLNIGKIIGREFIIHESIKRSKGINTNLNFRIDYDYIKGKHINSIELFENTITKESSPKYKSNVKKAYLYNSMLKYLYDENVPMPAGDDAIKLKEFIIKSRDEPNAQLIIQTNIAIKNGEKMSSKIAGDILQLFISDKAYLKNYFKDFKSALRPVIDCARNVYLTNEGNPKLEKDEYSNSSLHMIVSGYIRQRWKEEAMVLIRKLHELTNNESNKNISDEERMGLQLVRLKAIANYKASESAAILRNEIFHALNGNTGKHEVMEDLIKFFDKKLSLFEEFFKILFDSSEKETIDSLREFNKILFDSSYRAEYLGKHKDYTEPSLKLSQLSNARLEANETKPEENKPIYKP